MFYVPKLHYCDQLTERKRIREDLRKQLPDYVYVERAKPEVMLAPAPFVAQALEALHRHGPKTYHLAKALRPNWNYTFKPEIPAHFFSPPEGSWFQYPGMVAIVAAGAAVERNPALAGNPVDAARNPRLGPLAGNFRRACRGGSVPSRLIADLPRRSACPARSGRRFCSTRAGRRRPPNTTARPSPWTISARPRHIALGVALEKLGQREAAARENFAALEIVPRNRQAHYDLANILAKRGDVRGAIDHYLAALEADPGYAPAHVNLGAVLLGTPGGVEEAIDHFRSAVRLQPDLFEAHVQLGYASRPKAAGSRRRCGNFSRR